MDLRQFSDSTYLTLAMLLFVLNVLPLLEFFTAFSYFSKKIRTTFMVFLVAILCGAVPVGLSILVNVVYSDTVSYSRQESINTFHIVLSLLFPSATSVLILYNIVQIYELCSELDTCQPEEQDLLTLIRDPHIFVLLLASIFQTFFFWVLIHMMDIAEDRGNPYRLFQNQRRRMVS